MDQESIIRSLRKQLLIERIVFGAAALSSDSLLDVRAFQGREVPDPCGW